MNGEVLSAVAVFSPALDTGSALCQELNPGILAVGSGCRAMGHVVLLGDSIFDNQAFVPEQPALAAQLRAALGNDCRVTLLAVDGHCTSDVPQQLERVPKDATHLFVSAGGYDILSEGRRRVLHEPATSNAEALYRMAGIRSQFRQNYRHMLGCTQSLGKPTVVCTIYDAIPDFDPAASVAMAMFNDVILREAIAAQIPVIDLRYVCTEPDDYSHVSPIEPSARGGEKIVATIARIVRTHDFATRRTTVFA